MIPTLPRQRYIERVLELYRQTPGTRGHPRSADRRLAAQLHDRGVPFDTVNNALLLAAARRTFRPKDAPCLPPIASLHYFLPVMEELLATPPDPAYIEYLRIKLVVHRTARRRIVKHQPS